MKKKEIVKNKKYFNNIIKNNNFVKNDLFVIYFVESRSENPNFGIAVGKKLGNAVFRNKKKRIIRVILDKNKLLFPNNRDYIIMLREAGINKTFTELEQGFKKLLKEKVQK